LSAAVKRLRGSWIEDADGYHIVACDDVGPWEYSPEGGLQPIDYAELLPALRDPVDQDTVCRAVLERRLAFDGHSIHDARRALAELPWCWDSSGQPIAPEIEEYGWANTVRDWVVPIIRAEEERREAEAKTPRAIISGILANPIKYPLSRLRRKVLATIGDSPDGRLSRQELAVKVWGARLSMITQANLNNIGTTVCRINKDILDSGYTLSTDRDDLYRTQSYCPVEPFSR
jgi:hypothetical protein